MGQPDGEDQCGEDSAAENGDQRRGDAHHQRQDRIPGYGDPQDIAVGELHGGIDSLFGQGLGIARAFPPAGFQCLFHFLAVEVTRERAGAGGGVIEHRAFAVDETHAIVFAVHALEKLQALVFIALGHELETGVQLVFFHTGKIAEDRGKRQDHRGQEHQGADGKNRIEYLLCHGLSSRSGLSASISGSSRFWSTSGLKRYPAPRTVSIPAPDSRSFPRRVFT